jgi:RimJ/RimL family protein N-acetyltransferase
VELRDGDIDLRPWTLDDVPSIVAACNDAEIQHWIPVIPRPYTEADARAFVRGDVAGIGSHIGYWCASEARGRGVTARALRLLCKHSFDELELGRLELITDPDNRASQRVAEKVGFRREGVLRSHLAHPDGRRRDSVMFSLLPGELV